MKAHYGADTLKDCTHICSCCLKNKSVSLIPLLPYFTGKTKAQRDYTVSEDHKAEWGNRNTHTVFFQIPCSSLYFIGIITIFHNNRKTESSVLCFCEFISVLSSYPLLCP